MLLIWSASFHIKSLVQKIPIPVCGLNVSFMILLISVSIFSVSVSDSSKPATDVPLSFLITLMVNSSVSSVTNSLIFCEINGVDLFTSIALDSILSLICSLEKNLIGLFIPSAAVVPSAARFPVRDQPVLRISVRVWAS